MLSAYCAGWQRRVPAFLLGLPFLPGYNRRAKNKLSTAEVATRAVKQQQVTAGRKRALQTQRHAEYFEVICARKQQELSPLGGQRGPIAASARHSQRTTASL
eukprot:TRINITY_DN2569_c0_g1_i12.p2 TRINITY_DN2569_c0_g1~~TRINITY_DN2569_c0_g1_i12.p2  ORF type:complete len:102 (-),score=14.59 TRINITY_DN2569_c0_g1_i12:850-1155(-)